MIPSEAQQIFVHLPKVAGTSFRSLLGDVFGEDNVSPPFTVNRLQDREAKELASFQVISGHISWFDIENHFPGRRLLTILRDPIDRCLSVYGYFRQQTERPLISLESIRWRNDADEAISLARQLNPDEFFRSEHPHVMQNIRNRMVWQLGYHASIETRNDISEPEVLERAQANLRRFAFVGFFEHLDRDIGRFLAEHEIRGRHELPRLMQTVSPLHRRDLSSSALASIANHTEFDRRLYDAAEREFRQ